MPRSFFERLKNLGQKEVRGGLLSSAGSGRYTSRWEHPPRAELIGLCRYYADPPNPELEAFDDNRYWVRLVYSSNDDSDGSEGTAALQLSWVEMEDEPNPFLVATNIAEDGTHNAPGGYTLLWATKDTNRDWRYFIDVNPDSCPKLVKAIYDQRIPAGECGSYYLTVDVVEVSTWPCEEGYEEGTDSFVVHLPFTWGVNWPNVGSGDYFFVERMKAPSIDGSGGDSWWVPTNDSYLDGTIGEIMLWHDPDNIKRGWAPYSMGGKFLVTLDPDDPDFDTLGKEGGYKYHGPAGMINGQWYDANNHEPHEFEHYHRVPDLYVWVSCEYFAQDPNGIPAITEVGVCYDWIYSGFPPHGSTDYTDGPVDADLATMGALVHSGGPIPFDDGEGSTTSNLPPYKVIFLIQRVEEPFQP